MLPERKRLSGQRGGCRLVVEGCGGWRVGVVGGCWGGGGAEGCGGWRILAGGGGDRRVLVCGGRGAGLGFTYKAPFNAPFLLLHLHL